MSKTLTLVGRAKTKVIKQVIFKGLRDSGDADGLTAGVIHTFRELRGTGFTPPLFGALTGHVIGLERQLDVGHIVQIIAHIELDEESVPIYNLGVILRFKAHIDRGALRALEVTRGNE